MNDITVQIITDENEFLDLRHDWNNLLDQSPDGNPFLTWEWQYNWWKHFGKGRSLNIILARRNDEIVAIFPFMREQFGVGQLKIQELNSISYDIGDYGGFILGDGSDDAVEVVADYLAEQAGKANTAVKISRVPQDTYASRSLSRILQRLSGKKLNIRQQGSYECPYLPVQNGTIALPKSHAPRFRRLHEAHRIEFHYHRGRNIAADMALLQDMHLKRWSDKGQTMRGLFATPERGAFINDVVESMNPMGNIRLSFVTADDEPISGVLGFEFGRRYYYFRPAMNPAFNKYSPGHILIYYILMECQKRGITEFDFLRGQESYKSIWAPSARTVSSTVMVRSGQIGKTYQLAFRGLKKIQMRMQAGHQKMHV